MNLRMTGVSVIISFCMFCHYRNYRKSWRLSRAWCAAGSRPGDSARAMADRRMGSGAEAARWAVIHNLRPPSDPGWRIHAVLWHVCGLRFIECPRAWNRSSHTSQKTRCMRHPGVLEAREGLVRLMIVRQLYQRERSVVRGRELL